LLISRRRKDKLRDPQKSPEKARVFMTSEGGIDYPLAMSKSQDAKKNTKKAPTRTPKEKKELKRAKKAAK